MVTSGLESPISWEWDIIVLLPKTGLLETLALIGQRPKHGNPLDLTSLDQQPETTLRLRAQDRQNLTRAGVLMVKLDGQQKALSVPAHGINV